MLGKTIYCNCDNANHSNFVRYFRNNFDRLELKELIASHRNLDGTGGVATYNGLDWTYRELQNGSYDSEELTEYLNRADIVVTNPPFSVLAHFFKFLISNNKDFIILGNLSATNSTDMFQYFKAGRIFHGHNVGKGNWFLVPEKDYNGRKTRPLNNKHYLQVRNTTWWTSYGDKNIKSKVKPTASYDPSKHLQYFNYNAINVDKIKDIPKDYYDEMGVPVTYLYQHNPELFDLIGLSNKVPKTRKDVPEYPQDVWIEKDGKPWKCPYKRIIIKRRKI